MAKNFNYKPARNDKRVAFILAAASECNPTWNKSLQGSFERLLWFANFDELISNVESCDTLIIDTDFLPSPVEKQLKTLIDINPDAKVYVITPDDSNEFIQSCMESGCTDVLIKPVGANEIAWMLRKQKGFIEETTNSEKNAVLSQLSQISNASTEALIHLSTVECLQTLFFGTRMVTWLKREADTVSVLSTSPRNTHPNNVLEALDKSYYSVFPIDVRDEARGKCLLLPVGPGGENFVFLWGLGERVTDEQLGHAKIILEYAHLSLMNLKNFSELKKQTYIDDLTGLYNAKYFKQAVRSSISRCRYNGQPFSVLFIDIDHFKKVNDTHGHLVGSELLIGLAKEIKLSLRGVDLVFRYGGDEFVVVLNDAAVDQAALVAERLRHDIEKSTFEVRGKSVNVTASIGVSTFPIHADSPDEMIELADAAMYDAKNASRNAIHVTKARTISREEETSTEEMTGRANFKTSVH